METINAPDLHHLHQPDLGINSSNLATMNFLTTILTLATLAAAQHGAFYDRCQCMSENNKGKAAGVANDFATQGACNYYTTMSNGIDVSMNQNWCQVNNATQPGVRRIKGDDFWELCVDRGAASGNCNSSPR